MMKQLNFLIKVIPFLFFLLSCNNNSENNKLIIGNWTGVEWLVNGAASSHSAGDTHFTFTDKGEYSFEYGENREKGTYKIENDMLFTTPAGEQEMMVKITLLKKDSLIFDMNRGGQPETLTLLKK